MSDDKEIWTHGEVECAVCRWLLQRLPFTWAPDWLNHRLANWAWADLRPPYGRIQQIEEENARLVDALVKAKSAIAATLDCWGDCDCEPEPSATIPNGCIYQLDEAWNVLHRALLVKRLRETRKERLASGVSANKPPTASNRAN